MMEVLMPVELSAQIDPTIIAVLAVLVCIGLGIRAIRNKDWARFGDIIPRLFLAGIYIMFELRPDMPVDERAVWVRYGLVSLLTVELIYLLFRMYWKIQTRLALGKKAEAIINEQPTRIA